MSECLFNIIVIILLRTNLCCAVVEGTEQKT